MTSPDPLDWPPGLQTPDAGMIYRTCIDRFGSEYHGKAMAAAVTAIWTREIIYPVGQPRNMWKMTSALCGVKSSTLKQAYQRSGNKRWARWLAVGMMNELVRKQTALTRK